MSCITSLVWYLHQCIHTVWSWLYSHYVQWWLVSCYEVECSIKLVGWQANNKDNNYDTTTNNHKVDYLKLTARELVRSAGILSNLPKKILNGLHHTVMDAISETRRLSLGRLSRDIVIFSPRNLLFGIAESLDRYYYSNNLIQILKTPNMK